MKTLHSLLFIFFISSLFAQDYLPQRDTFFQADNYANRYLAVFDFNDDGFQDILLGGDNGHILEKTPIHLLINQGDGTFTDEASTYINGDLVSANPISTVADFNGDDILDVAIFDAGNMELGQDPIYTGFYGEDASLLLSNTNGTWDISDVLAIAHQQANPFGHSECHIKYASSADIDNDGDMDILVESGGGSQQLLSHFYINDGQANFTADNSENRLSSFLFKGPNGQWRHQVHHFADLNNDGFLDLVLGQLRRIGNGQDQLTNFVVFNDGAGAFLIENAFALPYPDWNDGYTYVKSIMSKDLNHDGYLDLIYSQERAYDQSNNNAHSGNYFQVYLNNQDGTFYDETEQYFNLSDSILGLTGEYGINKNTSKYTMLVDVNEDCFDDIVTAMTSTPICINSPLIYLNDGNDNFSPIDHTRLNKNQAWMGEDSYPIDLNNNGMIDFVSSDLRPGPDGVYGTGDEYHQMFPIFGIRDYPLISTISVHNDESFKSGLNLTSIPDLGINYFYIDQIENGQLYTSDSLVIEEQTFIDLQTAEQGFLYTPASNYEGTDYFYLQGAVSTDTSTLVGSRFIAKIVVLSPPTSIQSPNATSNQIILYPNPTKGLIIIDELEDQSFYHLQIHNSLGNQVMSKSNLQSVNRIIQIDCRHLASGSYSISLQTKKGTKTGKFIIVN